MATTVRCTAVRLCAVVLASAITIGSASLINPRLAFAEQCVGSNEKIWWDNRDVEHTVKIDSCKANELVDAYGDVKDAAGLTGALGAKWWPVGVASGIFFEWAWSNQAEIKSAAAAGRGVEFDDEYGIVRRARPQGS